MNILNTSKIQSQFWFLQNLNANTGAYNLFSVFEVSDKFSIPVFKKAVTFIITRHEALRTQLVFENNKLEQQILDNVNFEIPEIHITNEFNENNIPEELFNEVNKPFDLSIAPLFRFVVLCFGNGKRILSLTFHHSIIDVRSETVFSKEVSYAYNALINNKEPFFSESATQYSEYTKEILEWYNTPEYTQKLQSLFKDYPDSNQKLELPEDINTSASESGDGAGIYFKLDNELTRKINDFAKNHNSNTFRVLLAAYAIFLQRLSNQDFITIGLPLTNRVREKYKQTFGCFINALPLSIEFSESLSALDVLQIVSNKLKDNLDRQEVTFTDLVRESSRSSQMLKSPYFQAGFAIKPPMQLCLDGENLIPVKVSKNGAQLNLFFTFWEENDYMTGFAEYSTLLFSDERIRNWIENFKILLLDMLENPGKPAYELDILTPDDISAWKKINNTVQPYEDNICLHQKFEKQVEKSPDAIALKWLDKTLSYKSFNEHVNRLAHFLIDEGVKVGDIVAFSLERCPEMLISIYAIHKIGAAYLPFDTHAPEERLESIIEDAKPVLVLTKIESDKKLNNKGLKQIYVDDLLINPIHQRTENPNIPVSSQNTAYILYTSGSTGKPKGVPIKHHSVMNKIGWMQYKYESTPSDTFVLKTPVTFDVSVWELFWWYFNGANLLLLPPGGEKEPETIISEVEEKKATVIIFVPSMFTSFSSYLESMDLTAKLSSLKLIIQIGEALSPQLVRDFNKMRSKEFNPLMLNTYGPTEATVAVTYYDCPSEGEIDKIYIGKPIFNTQLYVVNKKNKIQPIGIPGELLITGVNLSSGYLNRPDLNADRFISINDITGNSERAYKTGDLSFLDKNGELDFLGRIDNQVKIRGYRIELGEIESRILEHQDVSNCAVLVHENNATGAQLVGYVTLHRENELFTDTIKDFLTNTLPEYMIPAHFIVLEQMPLTSSGKINRKELPKPKFSEEKKEYEAENDVQKILVKIYQEILGISQIGINSNFFELGGTSLLAPYIVVELKKQYNIPIKTVDIFEYPTILSLSNYIIKKSGNSLSVNENTKRKNTEFQKNNNRDIAVIGMAGCFPGAENIEKFWDNIVNNKVTIARFTEDELRAKGVAEELIKNNDYVYANGITDRADLFDASFFGISPKEADFMDPQHRVFLEICYEALESAGYSTSSQPLNVGVFAGTGMNNYLLKALMQEPSILKDLGEFQTMIGHDKDYLTTRVSYKLNLTGPSMDIQTACSTSLVAVHTACMNLINGECDMALSGGVYIHAPRGHGYMYKTGGILSPTGYCRPFDNNADGTVLGEGAGVVLLKRLDDAVRDNDQIFAVIKSTAINNDGANKVGYMAPSVEGQAGAISKAINYAGIKPETVGLIETHGTGTKLGDPIEISALKHIFSGNEKYCALGAVKANIGHLDAAAGVSGLIKTILCLKNKTIPAVANFSNYNPELEIENSPFYIPTESIAWKESNFPRRAGVSSFGIGGTNAHCIVEEYIEPQRDISNTSELYILPVSAKSEYSLTKKTEQLKEFSNNSNIADLALSLHKSNNSFKLREFLYGYNPNDAFNHKKISGKLLMQKPQTVFMFTGQGSQYFNMGRNLYDTFDEYRKVIDKANTITKSEYNFDLTDFLFNQNQSSRINETYIAQPLIVSTQLALVALLGKYGITPDVIIGHSIGEIAGACVAGIFSFEDTIRLAVERGKIMQAQQKGCMLSVNLNESTLSSLLVASTEIALINAPEYCVVSGTFEAITTLKSIIEQKFPEVSTKILETSHAFHSIQMEPAVESFRNVVKRFKKSTATIPLISNVSGEFITAEMSASDSYWADHIRKQVNFNKGLHTLLVKETVCLEVGPGSMLTSLINQQNTEIAFKSFPLLLSSSDSPIHTFFNAIGQFWCTGGDINWKINEKDGAKKISLPSYPFERKRHWLEPKQYFSFDTTQTNIPNELSSNTSSSSTSLSTIEDNVHLSEHKVLSPKEYVAKVWADLLGVENIGQSDDFFELGGHSLLASQAINKINKEFGSSLPLNTIFQYRTIESLSDILDTKTKENNTSDLCRKIEGNENLPVSKNQTRLWVISQFERNPAYNIPFTYRLNGNVDRATFQKSLDILFERHNILRSRVKVSGIEPKLFLTPSSSVDILFPDFSVYDESKRYSEIQKFISNDIRKVFDIANDDLYRIYLIKESPTSSIFHMTIHHIIFDGWSWGLFVREFNSIYNALAKGEKLPDTPLRNQYYEYAQWMQEQDTLRPLNNVDYWKTKLSGSLPLINFPLDYERKSKKSGIGARVHFEIPKDTSEKIKLICKKYGVTEFTVYITAFSLLLNKYSGDNDICVGIPSANRPNSNFESIIGFFVNTLIIRFKIDTQESFSDYLSTCKKSILEAIEHQDIDFNMLVEALQPPRMMNVNPLFQIMFSWLNAPHLPFNLSGVTSERYFVREGVSPLDLTAYVWEENGKIEGDLEFNTDIFSEDTITRFASNYTELLTSVATESSASVSQLNILSSKDIIDQNKFNDTVVDVKNTVVPQLFQNSVKNYPQKISVISGDSQLSYSELEIWTNRIAQFLLSKGIKPNDIVGVSLNRSALMLATIIGIHKAGAAYLPLDPSFPGERLSYIISDAQAKILITESILENNIETPITRILIDNYSEEISKLQATKPTIDFDGDMLAYLIYTSGSTGNPKGVKVQHSAVVNFIESMAAVPGFSSDDVLLAVTTLSFDISVLEMFLPLFAGGTVVIASKSETVNGKALGNLIDKHNVTVLQATPATWNILNFSGWNGNKNLKALCGGEAITQNLIQELLPKVKELWNMYGPTETTVWSTCEQIVTSDLPILVGKPINNTSIYILSQDNKVLPLSCTGEVCIGGKGVTKGYHNRPDITAEKFVTLSNGELIYKTGDYGRIRFNGKIELFGRIDNQIKLRGFRIEPGEIESRINASDGIIESVVKVQNFGNLDDRLVAFVLINDSFTGSEESIIVRLKTVLPDYMVPVHIEILKEFPRTPNGKIDKNKLVLIPKVVSGSDQTTLTPSLNEKDLESGILEIWKKVLQKDTININDNFFDIGGNSLLLIQTADRINSLIGSTIDVMYFFEFPTIKSFSDHINKTLKNNSQNNTSSMGADRFRQAASRRRK